MPVAVVLPNDIEHFDLKSLPEGYVELRRMTYGQKLYRMQEVSQMSMSMQKGQKDVKARMEMMQSAAAILDYRNCVVSHNLQDANGQLLDFKNSASVSALHPRIGEEISSYIDKMNNFEEGDEGNSESASEQQ